MAKTKQHDKDAAYVLRRLVEDEHVHDQLSEAAARLNKAYRRARRKKGAEAAEDRKLYAHVRAAVGSLRRAGIALQRKPPPKPKRRGRKLLLAGALAIGAGLLAKRASGRTEGRDYADRPSEPVEPARHDNSSTAAPATR
jgi:uncharacterized membrane protein YccC